MVSRSETDSILDRITSLEDLIPGIQIKSQQQDQSTITVEGRVNVIESKILELQSLEAIMDAKIKTAVHMTEGRSQGFAKPILESKAISEVGKLTDAKSYRPWNRKVKNAIDQIRPTGRKVMEMLESITESITESIQSTSRDVYRCQKCLW